jgi:hypothetical protein
VTLIDALVRNGELSVREIMTASITDQVGYDASEQAA